MTATSATVDHAKAIDAIGLADWYLAQAYITLVPVLLAAHYVEGAEPDVATDALLATIRETQTLEKLFTEARDASDTN